MLTSAIFLQAASVGIPTAQPLKTGLRRSFTAIARSGLLLQSKGKSSVTFADRSRQEKSHTPRVLPSYNVFARPFHASAVCRRNCGWGPCDCAECIYDIGRGRDYEPICEICYVNPTAHELAFEHGGTPWAPYTSYCQECAEKRWEEERRQMEAKAKIAAAY